MTIPFGGFVPTGWVCPKCGSGNNPSAMQCPCNAFKTRTTTDATSCQHHWVDATDTSGSYSYCVKCHARLPEARTWGGA